MSKSVIYDFETLGQDQRRSAVISFALLEFDESRYYNNPYTYRELVNSCKYIKFDVMDQVDNYDRTINKQTLEWWNEQGDRAKQQLKPSGADRKIVELFDFIKDNCDLKSIKKSYTRGNTFDPMFLQYLMVDIEKVEPFHWRTVRDTRSMIEGMSYGLDVGNNFILDEVRDEFVKHDPCHDISMDVFRMQSLAITLHSK